jgi:hypothetical protein
MSLYELQYDTFGHFFQKKKKINLHRSERMRPSSSVTRTASRPSRDASLARETSKHGAYPNQRVNATKTRTKTRRRCERRKETDERCVIFIRYTGSRSHEDGQEGTHGFDDAVRKKP